MIFYFYQNESFLGMQILHYFINQKFRGDESIVITEKNVFFCN